MESFVSLPHIYLALKIVLGAVFLLTFGVLVVSLVKYQSYQARKAWIPYIDTKIVEAVVDGIEEFAIDTELERHLKNTNFRKQFLNSLVGATRRFSGKALQDIYALYHRLGLQEDSVLKIVGSKQKYTIATGIQELTAMHCIDKLDAIQAKLISPNTVVLHEAQYAMVKLKGFEGLQFLDTLQYPLSDWQQMRLLKSITIIPNGSESTIIRWLNSSDTTIVVFTLRLIRKMQLLSCYQAVLSLQHHAHDKVVIQVVKTLQALENEDTLTDLIAIFNQHNAIVQKEVIKVLKISSNRQSVDFLKSQLLYHTTPSIQLNAAEALLSMGQKPYLVSLLNTSDNVVQRIIKHVLLEKE